ncbi:hypothetical protein RF11_15831 [Thelohanellus kitauei]|uniref:Uncharacterized protein n=1 Tax=Thelohanellus kitauei TaxID=669202 RepID=A0A0C2I5M8_THEKT|nr:hypothetical protein RF11_15831 [Thelohanellus kitauei]
MDGTRVIMNGNPVCSTFFQVDTVTRLFTSVRKHAYRVNVVDLPLYLDSEHSKKTIYINIWWKALGDFCRLEATCESGHQWISVNDRQENLIRNKVERNGSTAEKSLCSQIMKGNAMNVVVKTTNFIRTKGLNTDNSTGCWGKFKVLTICHIKWKFDSFVSVLFYAAFLVAF